MSSGGYGGVNSGGGKTRNRNRGKRFADPDYELSRSLSWALRHAAPSLGLPMGTDGYVPVEAVLSCSHPRFSSKTYTLGDVQRVVERNDKRRFRLERRRPLPRMEGGGTIDSSGGTVDWDREADEGAQDGEWFIRANQGHSISAVLEENLLTPISQEELRGMDTIVHGTTRSAWDRHIRREGLSRMSRNHIHFASGLRVISGMRATSQVHIFVDGERCAQDAVQFFRSDNGVILSAGVNNKGILPLGYISRVIDAESRQVLFKSDSPPCNQHHNHGHNPKQSHPEKTTTSDGQSP